MIRQGPAGSRELNTQHLGADLVVVGGGLAGVCCAITAARAGLKVVLVQDRPVLGGNSSSEVRLWVLGATSHMGNNNRWAREGGVIDEILVENTFRNPEGNAIFFDALLLEKVTAEPNVTLLLNTAAYEVRKSATDPDAIAGVRAFCSQNSTAYELTAPLFCDASGDGILGFLSGAAFRMGAETADEFGEKFAPSEDYGALLGHTMYFYSKDAGRPVRFTAPAFAMKDVRQVPRWRSFNSREHGCKLWWIEYGGRLDTVHDTERIKWELWKVVYGVWDHIKNSGLFPEAANLTLEWVSTIPGKRESRRFEGDYMLSQRDVVEQRRHPDDVSYGGWAIDLHPADGVFSEKPGCNQWHSKGIYPIPYRCMYSRNVPNLFLAGRIISATHVAFGSSRVMATCAHGGQAVGMAAALCAREGLRPRDLAQPRRVERLQLELQRRGQYIPGADVPDSDDLAARAAITASSRLVLDHLPAGGRTASLSVARAMLLPVAAGRMPRVTLFAAADEPADLQVELRTSSRKGNFTPDVVLARRSARVGGGRALASAEAHHRSRAAADADAGAAVATAVAALERPHGAGGTRAPVPGLQPVTIDFDVTLDAPRYVFLCLMPNPAVSVALSDVRVTGVLALVHEANERVAEGAVQTPPADIGVDTFEFWLPERRPHGQNLALRLDPPADVFGPQALARGPDRPTTEPNAWVADPADPAPAVELRWPEPRPIGRIELSFDTDLDHAMETVLWGHPERVMPFCVRRYRVLDGRGRVLAEVLDNHQTRNTVRLSQPVTTDRIRIEVEHPSAEVPAALFRVRCYGE